jgi:UDP-N-acetylmuramoyl-L-alanyl-D-glutamate--2,6-diaminopimelate ligase
LQAKLSIADELKNSCKENKYLIVNVDDKEANKFLEKEATEKFTCSLVDTEPYTISDNGIVFHYRGDAVVSPLKGKFNIYNMTLAATCADALGVDKKIIIPALSEVDELLGRVQKVSIGDKQKFEVIVDYAHTADSLKQLYEAFPNHKKFAILGSTGGGRDKWKRPQMGAIADEFCDYIILSNEDPYDEDPTVIIKEVESGIKNRPHEIILDRKEAIAKLIELAQNEIEKNPNDKVVVLLSGKGTDPFLMEANNKKTPWNEAKIAEEILQKFFAGK